MSGWIYKYIIYGLLDYGLTPIDNMVSTLTEEQLKSYFIDGYVRRNRYRCDFISGFDKNCSIGCDIVCALKEIENFVKGRSNDFASSGT